MKFLQRLESLKERISIIAEGAVITKWFDKKTLDERTAPIVTSDSFVKLLPNLTTLLEQLKAEVVAMTVDNRITFSEFVHFIGRSTRLIYGTIAQLQNLDPAERKATVLVAVDEFYTRVLAPLDIPYVPAFLENSYVDPLIGTWVHTAAEALYDIIVNSIASGLTLGTEQSLQAVSIHTAVLDDTAVFTDSDPEFRNKSV